MGAHDFDFVHGRWNVHNRKLRDVADPDCTEWVTFEAWSQAFPVLDGYGHIDRMHVPDPPDGDPFEGLTLRLFDPTTDLWSIWWSSTRAPGRLDPQLTGRFVDTVGTFACSDVLAGRPVQVRFEWFAEPVRPIWEQSFSFDGGRTWLPNWQMTLTRRVP